MAEPREPDDVAVSACPRCGAEKRAYKCECESPPVNPVWMPRVAAERLRELYRKAFPPARLTATPKVGTVWVDKYGVLFRPKVKVTNHEAARDCRDGWVQFSPSEWRDFRETVDKFMESARES